MALSPYPAQVQESDQGRPDPFDKGCYPVKSGHAQVRLPALASQPHLRSHPRHERDSPALAAHCAGDLCDEYSRVRRYMT